jgi:hypothetical protein
MGPEHPQDEGFHGFRLGKRWDGGIESCSAGDQVPAVTVGEKPTMVDALKAWGARGGETGSDSVTISARPPCG